MQQRQDAAIGVLPDLCGEGGPMTPLVFSVLASPSTCTTSSVSGPSAVKVWLILPKASSCEESGQSAETSIRQDEIYWPS
jgi:hypothetical protein